MVYGGFTVGRYNQGLFTKKIFVKQVAMQVVYMERVTPNKPELNKLGAVFFVFFYQKYYNQSQTENSHRQKTTQILM